ncbi:radical SAM protein [Bradyrhizobium sp. Tv2a-2]|uniref:radical SAM protein n=1 Tax=Bradyrhizobium sp. Tv2a-2 TaxID=113395 RepID=UPI0003F80C7A|nr:radical SAM protein [Bradyrhizobium sp. Tv2a-2]
MLPGNSVPIIFDHLRICISVYCNLRCEHCYFSEEYRDQYKRLLEPFQLSIGEITSFIDLLLERYLLRKISVTGGEPLLEMVFPRSAALMAHANKRGLQVQLNTRGLGQVQIRDIVSIFDDPQKLILQFSFDGANRETMDRFRGRPGVYASALRQMFEAVHCGALVQAKMTANRQNIGEALEAYRLLSSIGIDSFRIEPVLGSGVALGNADSTFVSAEEVKYLQEALITKAAHTSTRLELPRPIFVDTSKPRLNVEFAETDCGATSVYLFADGDLYRSPYVAGTPDSQEVLVGNIRAHEFDLDTAWRKSPALERFRANTGRAKCWSELALLKNVEKGALACA